MVVKQTQTHIQTMLSTTTSSSSTSLKLTWNVQTAGAFVVGDGVDVGGGDGFAVLGPYHLQWLCAGHLGHKVHCVPIVHILSASLNQH